MRRSSSFADDVLFHAGLAFHDGGRETHRWLLQVGELFPDLWADSTQGPLALHDWARGHFVVLFSLPVAYSEMSETDVVAFAGAQEAFLSRGVELLGVSQSDPRTERDWIDEIETRHGIEVRFPILSDEDGRIARMCGLYHENSASAVPVSKTFVIGPDLKIRAVSECPTIVPRAPAETLRVIDAFLRR